MQRRFRKEAGQGMVEFALTLPLLLMLVIGVMEFGRLLFFYSAITTGTREAARYGAGSGLIAASEARYQDCQGIRDSAKRISALAGIQDGDIVIAYDQGPGEASLGTCPVGGSGPALDLGDRIIVTVSGEFQPVVPIINVPPLEITSVARRTILKDVEVK
ncbi:MAG TPA: TadE family protein [Anaerolineales bacterium]